jgi:hypothetical protein
MEKIKSIMFPLLAAGLMGMAHAQELLFTATLQDKLAGRDFIVGEIAPLTSQNKTIGFLVSVWQGDQGYEYDYVNNIYTDMYTDYKDRRSLLVLSLEGQTLQTLPTNTKYEQLENVELIPFGEGGFCVITDSTEFFDYVGGGGGYALRCREMVFYDYSNGAWVEKKRIQMNTSQTNWGPFDKDESVFPKLANPTATFALFKDEGNKVVAEVYVANEQTLTPAPLPTITSDLSELAVKRGKVITPYATTTNFQTTGFSAVGLPAGLSIDPVSGVISGKSSARGVFNVLLVVSQAGGQPVVATKRISVK